jgi:hypothetical protein
MTFINSKAFRLFNPFILPFEFLRRVPAHSFIEQSTHILPSEFCPCGNPVNFLSIGLCDAALEPAFMIDHELSL